MDILSLAIAKKSGGGGSTNAVKYTPQELTEEQQMQARKNLGVYYESDETTTIEWDLDISGRTSFAFGPIRTLYKVSDVVFNREDLIDGIIYINGVELHLTDDLIEEIDPGLVATAESAVLSAKAGLYFDGMLEVPEDGTYFALIDEFQVTKIVVNKHIISQIEEKYLPDVIATKLYVDQQIGDAIGGEY